MSHAVNWFQIQGPNGHALQQFYKKVFGWKMKALPGSDDSMMVASEPGGIAGGVGTSQNHQPSVAVYVSVGDIDAVFGKIQRGGGRMAMPKTELPGGMGSIAGFHDPAGNWIGLWMPGKAAAAPKRSSSAKKAGGAKKAGAKKAGAKKAGAKKAGAKKAGAKKAGAAKQAAARGARSPAKKAGARASGKTSSGAKKR
ncbi:MAG TPA: VOC family protein [Labilithrix sp.]|nr:VOC family protein [Labilithrix sp.]